MKFSDILRTALHALRGNWMRSALTSLGVIIGIAAVIVMVSVGQGTQYVAGALRGNTQIVFAENNASTSWQGVQADFFEINSWVIANGEGFDAQDYSSADKVVILGETVRRTLFGEDSGVGQTVRLGRVPFTVVGTLAPKGQGGFGQDQDDVMMVPLETARRRLMGSMGLPPGAVRAR